jgi:hypothetical protein
MNEGRVYTSISVDRPILIRSFSAYFSWHPTWQRCRLYLQGAREILNKMAWKSREKGNG